MLILKYPWAVVVTNTLDEEVEVTVHETPELAKKALVDDLSREAKTKTENNTPHKVDMAALDTEGCARLAVMTPGGLERYRYTWQIVEIPDPEE